MADAVLASEIQLKTTGTVEAVQQLNAVANASRSMAGTVGTTTQSLGGLEHVMIHMGGGGREVMRIFHAISQASEAASAGAGKFGAILGNTLLTGGLAAGAVASFKMFEKAIEDTAKAYEQLGFAKMDTFDVLAASLGIVEPQLKRDKLDAEIAKLKKDLKDGDWSITAVAELEEKEKERWKMTREERSTRIEHAMDAATGKPLSERQRLENEMQTFRVKFGFEMPNDELREAAARIHREVEKEKLELKLHPKVDPAEIEAERQKFLDKMFMDTAVGTAAGKPNYAWLNFPTDQKSLDRMQGGTMEEKFRIFEAGYNKQLGELTPQTASVQGEFEKYIKDFQEANNGAMPSKLAAQERFRQLQAAAGQTDWGVKLADQFKQSGKWDQLGATDSERALRANFLGNKMAGDVQSSLSRAESAWQSAMENPRTVGAFGRGSSQEYSERIQTQLRNDPNLRKEATDQINALKKIETYNQKMSEAIAKMAGNPVALFGMGGN